MVVKLLVDIQDFGKAVSDPNPGLLRAGMIVAAKPEVAEVWIQEGKAELINV
jgi:hypothetical protein